MRISKPGKECTTLPLAGFLPTGRAEGKEGCSVNSNQLSKTSREQRENTQAGYRHGSGVKGETGLSGHYCGRPKTLRSFYLFAKAVRRTKQLEAFKESSDSHALASSILFQCGR